MEKQIKEDLKLARERLKLLDKLINKSCMTCINASCKVDMFEKIGYDENGLPRGSQCLSWYNEELISKSKDLDVYDINILKLI